MSSKRSQVRIKKYGVCLNDKCEKYKVVQEIVHGDLECSECKKKLSPCAPPKQKNNSKLKTIVVCAVIAAIVALLAWLLWPNGKPSGEVTSVSNTTKVTQQTDTAKMEADTAKVVEPLETEVAPQDVSSQPTQPENQTAASVAPVVPKQSAPVSATTAPVSTRTEASVNTSAKSNGTLRLSYGTYNGDIKDGYPNGQGRLTYSTSRQINRFDSKGRTANAGDYVIGEFKNGFFVHGKHYSSSGELLESLMIGVPASNSFESK